MCSLNSAGFGSFVVEPMLDLGYLWLDPCLYLEIFGWILAEVGPWWLDPSFTWVLGGWNIDFHCCLFIAFGMLGSSICCGCGGLVGGPCWFRDTCGWIPAGIGSCVAGPRLEFGLGGCTLASLGSSGLPWIWAWWLDPCCAAP